MSLIFSSAVASLNSKILTTRFDLPYIVAGKPAGLAVECPLPPASLLLPRHKDHIAFTKRQLVLVVLLEVVAGLHHLLPTSAVLRHLLLEKLSELVSQANTNLASVINMWVGRAKNKKRLYHWFGLSTQRPFGFDGGQCVWRRRLTRRRSTRLRTWPLCSAVCRHTGETRSL